MAIVTSYVRPVCLTIPKSLCNEHRSPTLVVIAHAHTTIADSLRNEHRKSATWLRICHLAHNFLSILTWTKKTVLEECQERTRQGEEGILVGEWYVCRVHKNFLYKKGHICTTWFRICLMGYNFLSTYTWTKKIILEEGQERTRQGKDGSRSTR